MIKKILFWIKHVVIFTLISFFVSFPLCFLIGFLLPVDFDQVRTKNFYTSKKVLWSVLSDVESYPVWKPLINEVTVSEETSEELFPVYWIEFDTSSRKYRWNVINWEPLMFLELETMPSKRFKQTISYRIREDEDSTHLSIKISGEYKNPFQRFTQRFVHNQKQYLDSLLLAIDDQIKRLEDI